MQLRPGKIIVVLATGALLTAATAAPASYLVGYDYYVYATGGDGGPIADNANLNGETFTWGQVSMQGNASAGNHASIEYLANLASGGVVARASAVGGVCGDWPYGFTATGRVEMIRLADRLTFQVPAGTYPDGVQVSLTGHVSGQLSATYAASATVRYSISWGGILHDPGLLSIGNEDELTITVDDPFNLVKQIVAPGTTLAAPAEYPVDLQAYIGNARTATILEGASPDYITGSAAIDFAGGVIIQDVIAPDGVTWTSESGVFLSRPSPVRDLADVAPICTMLRNYPNPSNPRTEIAFELAQDVRVELRVYDLAGRLVRRLIGGEVLGPGPHRAAWDGRDDAGRKLPAGTYPYLLEAGDFRGTGRIVLVK